MEKYTGSPVLLIPHCVRLATILRDRETDVYRYYIIDLAILKLSDSSNKNSYINT